MYSISSDNHLEDFLIDSFNEVECQFMAFWECWAICCPENFHMLILEVLVSFHNLSTTTCCSFILKVDTYEAVILVVLTKFDPDAIILIIFLCCIILELPSKMTKSSRTLI